MSADAFRRYAHELVDWLIDYRERRVEELPVASPVEPGAIRRRLPIDPPQRGEPFDAMLADVDEILLPGITHWQSPDFFAYFPANASYPSVLGELLSAGLGVQGMLWATSPACTELETHVLDWLADMLALPERFRSAGAGGGVIQDSASSATLCALLAARERATEGRTNQQGVERRLTGYASDQAHSSVVKAMGIAGVGREQLRLVATDERFAMDSKRLAAAIAEDRAAGSTPFFVCANVGSTSSNAIDPLREIGLLCRQEGVWLHVDAAMSGTATVCPEFRWLHQGLEHADSYCVNPHKWMFTNFDCDCFYLADREALIRALTVLPEYLKNRATSSGAVIDYRDWQIPLGRRFRALKLWFVIRHYGVEGLQFHVRRHVELAQRFRSWVEDDELLELAAPAPLNLVCFRHRGGDKPTQLLLDRVNGTGELYMTHTVLGGRTAIRFCVGQTRTEERHVIEAWRQIHEAARALDR